MDTTTILPNLQHDQQHSTNGCTTTTTTTSTTLNNPSKLINATTTNPFLSKLKSVRKRRTCGKKDKQSKIHTAQGLRDRRMRLSVHTARKFFDLNDMLGFDKASKTIEWLFSKSHEAIQEVTETIQSDAAAAAQTVSIENNDIGTPFSACETESVMERIMIKNCDDHNMKESSCYPVEVSDTYHFLKHLHLDNITTIPTTNHTIFDYNKTVAEPPACWLNSRNPLLGFHGGWSSENHRLESNRITPLNGNMNSENPCVMSSNFIDFNSENQGQ